MKILTLMRHAKSSWDDPGLADVARPLNRRGKRDAPAMGVRLAARGVHPDLIVCSHARRARKTAEKVARELGYPVTGIRVDERIYGTEADAVFEVIRDLPADRKDVILVGHNPALTDLQHYLTGVGIDNVPTAGVARIVFHDRVWADVRRASGELAFFDSPKMQPPSS